MNEKQHGKREAPSTFPPAVWWKRYRAWVKGLTRGQRIRYRVCLALGIVAVIVLAAALSLRAWIRLPDVPEPPGPVMVGDTSGVLGDLSAGGTGLTYEGAELPDVARSGRKSGYYTFLVAGQDVVSGGTDTMLLFTYDTQDQRVTAISLLRDTMINTSASSKRLNAVYARNRGSGKELTDKEKVDQGMAALRQEVSKLTGIYPDFYVLVKWEAIGELVDAIGGVSFEVPFDMDYDDPYQNLHIHQKAGLRDLTGEDAMEVIRFRKNNSGSISLGDSGRTQIQRDFLTAVIKECLQPDILLKLPALAQVFLDNVNTDLSVGNILAFAELAIGMDTENDVNFVSMPFDNTTYQGAALALARQDELLELLNDGLNPYQDEIKASDLQLMYRKSGGGFDVTNATLADPAMGRGTVSKPKTTTPAPSSSSSPSQTEDPETQPPPEETDPEQTGGNTEPGGITDIDPMDVFPEVPTDQTTPADLPDPEPPAEPEPEPAAPAAEPVFQDEAA